MNNLLSYCGLVDSRIIASEKDLPVRLSEKAKKIWSNLALRLGVTNKLMSKLCGS